MHPPPQLEHNRLRLGEQLTVAFQRTLRLPDVEGDERNYPLPPGLGPFPLHRAADYAGRVPPAWVEQNALFFPMYRREAMWIGFDGAPWKPNAVKVGIGGVNAVSGTPWDEGLHDSPQDYLVVPDQPWLDGINAGEGFIKQFVAVRLGEGLSVEAQVTGAETVGGIQILAFEPRPGRFPDSEPPQDSSGPVFSMMPQMSAEAPFTAGGAMGLGAGGRMRQHVYPDPHGLEVWLPDPHCTAFVHIVDALQYRAITGTEPPASPVDARTYTEHGLPWFDLYDEDAGDVAPPSGLAKVRSVGELERERGSRASDDQPLDVAKEQVHRLRHRKRPS